MEQPTEVLIDDVYAAPAVEDQGSVVEVTMGGQKGNLLESDFTIIWSD